MNLTSTRSVEPLSIEGTFEFDEADLNAAFTDQNDPDENLFYLAFSNEWNKLPMSQKLSVLSQIAALAETAQMAGAMNLSGSVEPKE